MSERIPAAEETIAAWAKRAAAHVEAVARVMCEQSDLDRAHCLTHEVWSISFDGQTCRAGREVSEAILTSTDPDVHAALLAALAPVIEARVREARAEAWDDGYRSGYSNAMRWMSDEPTAPTTPNPYRAEEVGG